MISLANKFQTRVRRWVVACFGEEIADEKKERNHRFLEEALELVQSLKCTRAEAHQLVDYVFDRPVGDPPQETGGVMVTLAALCAANDLDMETLGWDELERVWVKIEKIREKQRQKPQFGPLPALPPSLKEYSLRDYSLDQWWVEELRNLRSSTARPTLDQVRALVVAMNLAELVLQRKRDNEDPSIRFGVDEQLAVMEDLAELGGGELTFEKLQSQVKIVATAAVASVCDNPVVFDPVPETERRAFNDYLDDDGEQ